MFGIFDAEESNYGRSDVKEEGEVQGTSPLSGVENLPVFLLLVALLSADRARVQSTGVFGLKLCTSCARSANSI
jgi:hypothetical protein